MTAGFGRPREPIAALRDCGLVARTIEWRVGQRPEWLWCAVSLSKLPRAEKQLRVMLDWTLDLPFSKDLVQSETRRSHHEWPQANNVPTPTLTLVPAAHPEGVRP